MSFKLNTELVNTAAVVEAAAPEITEAAKEAVNNTVEPVHTGDTIKFGTNGNFESTHKGYLIWDEGVAYENHRELKNVTQIKQNKGFKVKAAANATITITFYTNYGQYFLVDNVRVTSDVYTITTTEDKEIYVTTDLAGGAYIVSFYISKTNFSINDVLFKNVMPLGGGDGIRVDGSLSAGYSHDGEDDYYAVDFNLQHNNIMLKSCADGGDYVLGELKITDNTVNMHVHQDNDYDSDFTMGDTTIDLLAGYSDDATKIHLAPTTFEVTVCDTSTDPDTVKQALTLSDVGFNTETDAVNMQTADYYNNGKVDDIAKLNIVPTSILLSAKDYYDFDGGHALVTEAGISISADDVQMAVNLPENEDRGEYMTKNTSFSLAGENTVFSVNTANGYGYNTTADAGNSINGHISMLTYDGTGSSSVSNSRIELYIQNNDNDQNPTSKIELKPEAITIDNDGSKLKVSGTDGLQFSNNNGQTWHDVALADAAKSRLVKVQLINIGPDIRTNINLTFVVYNQSTKITSLAALLAADYVFIEGVYIKDDESSMTEYSYYEPVVNIATSSSSMSIYCYTYGHDESSGGKTYKNCTIHSVPYSAYSITVTDTI